MPSCLVQDTATAEIYCRSLHDACPICLLFDAGGGGGIEGLEDVTTFPTLTARLVAAGFTQDDLNKFWGGNALRVFGEVQAAAAP